MILVLSVSSKKALRKSQFKIEEESGIQTVALGSQKAESKMTHDFFDLSHWMVSFTKMEPRGYPLPSVRGEQRRAQGCTC